MAVELYDAVNNDGLFNVLGKVFQAQQDINTSRGTTIPSDILDVLTYFANITPNATIQPTIEQLTTAVAGYQGAVSGTMATLQAFAQQFLIAMVRADSPQTDGSLRTALTTLIAQMVAGSQSVESSAVAITVTAGGSNVGNGVLLATKKRGDGRTQENALAETLTATVGSNPLGMTLTSVAKASSLLGQDWPGGSGLSRGLSVVNAASGASLVTNGGFDTATANANVPDSWSLTVGTPGTTCSMTTVEVQTVAISGTPTGGHYYLQFTEGGKTYLSSVLAFNATSSDVQAALRTIPGLESVTVAQSGTTPNYTHTVTFAGKGGNVAQLTSISALTGGTPAITHGTTTAGTAQVLAGNAAVILTGNGSELTTLQQRVTLSPSTAYAISLWACCDVVPGAGVITIDLVDGVGGTVLQDAQGVNNAIAFNASALLTTWQHLKTLQAAECAFRTPAVLPAVVYLRVRFSTAVTNTRKVFFDQLALTAFNEAYPGGPLLAAFAGGTPFAAADTFSVAVTNDRAGAVREWCNRNFDMAALGLLFPTSGSPTVPDSVIN